MIRSRLAGLPAATLCAALAGLIAGCTSSVAGAPVQGPTSAVTSDVGGSDWATVGPTPSVAPSTATSGSGSPAGTGTPATPTWDPSTVVPESAITTSGAAGRTVGDLGLTEKISTVDCAGDWIVLLGSAANPKTYAADVQRMRQVHPGSHYLRTDRACTSLTQKTKSGDHIYVVYFGPYNSIEKACQVLALTGQDAQVRKLAESVQRLGPERC